MWMADTIYLDYAATTPVDPAVVEEMVRYMGPDGVFANPASNSHALGQTAAKAVEDARERVAELIGAARDEVLWTSGATESINLAIKGVALARCRRGRHIVTSSVEHSAVLGTCRHLVGEGYEVTALRPDRNGMVTPEIVRDSLREDTILVSLMQVNNETGTVTDVQGVGEVCGERGVAFHVDAAQGLARRPLDVRKVPAGLGIAERAQDVRTEGCRCVVRSWQVGSRPGSADARGRSGTWPQGRHAGDASDSRNGQSGGVADGVPGRRCSTS